MADHLILTTVFDRMNYIELINKFWLINEEHSFKVTEIALFFYLLKVNNQCAKKLNDGWFWQESFKRNNSKIQADLGISFNTLKNARNRLQQRYVISFNTLNGSSNVEYSVAHTLSKYDEVTNEVLPRLVTRLLQGCDEVLPTKDRVNQAKENEIINEQPGAPPNLLKFKNEEVAVSDSAVVFFKISGERIMDWPINYFMQHYTSTFAELKMSFGAGLDTEQIKERFKSEYPVGYEFKDASHLINSVKYVMRSFRNDQSRINTISKKNGHHATAGPALTDF